MVTEKQKREIKTRMKSIKEAAKNNAPDNEVNKRVKELTDYLQQEGLINPFND